MKIGARDLRDPQTLGAELLELVAFRRKPSGFSTMPTLANPHLRLSEAYDSEAMAFQYTGLDFGEEDE